MPDKPKFTKQDVERIRKTLYHHVDCRHLAGIRFSLTDEGRRHKKELSILGMSSKETIRDGLQAVASSPFQTIFVVDEASGQVLFALTQNEAYAARAKKKKKPKPPTGPTAPPVTECCQLCAFQGGTSCQPLSDGSCICFGADRQPRDTGLDDELGDLTR